VLAVVPKLVGHVAVGCVFQSRMATDLSEYQIKLYEIYEFEDNIKMDLKERDWKSVECVL